MSGPERETSESVMDSPSPTSDGTPSSPAPPSFGHPDPEPEPGPRPEQAQSDFAVPLFGPDKPWWAATPGTDGTDDLDELPLPSGPQDESPEPAEPPEPPEPPESSDEAGPLDEPVEEEDHEDEIFADAEELVAEPEAIPPDPEYVDTQPVDTKAAAEQAVSPADNEESEESEEAALTPDAVLPPGVRPPEYTGPKHDTASDAHEHHPDGSVILVVSQAAPEEPQPFPQTGAQQPPRPGGPSEEQVVHRRNMMLIAMVAVVILIPATVLAAFGIASGSGDSGKTSTAERSARTAAPQGRRSAAPPPNTPRPTPVDISNEKSDPRPLALVEVFPQKEMEVADRIFVQDRTSVNHQCGLAARGAMATALEQGGCRSVVRATYVNRINTIAVTSGVAVMPTQQAALAANQAGRPAIYEWFRGMAGDDSPDIDRTGGHAASTVRGRYIVYAYATYADGTVPTPQDAALKQVADAFIANGLLPLNRRANGLP